MLRLIQQRYAEVCLWEMVLSDVYVSYCRLGRRRGWLRTWCWRRRKRQRFLLLAGVAEALFPCFAQLPDRRRFVNHTCVGAVGTTVCVPLDVLTDVVIDVGRGFVGRSMVGAAAWTSVGIGVSLRERVRGISVVGASDVVGV
eukprot:6175955-Pleurochrysis_carterae.AAC.1